MGCSYGWQGSKTNLFGDLGFCSLPLEILIPCFWWDAEFEIQHIAETDESWAIIQSLCTLFWEIDVCEVADAI